MDHQVFPFITMGAIVGVREADVNGFIEAAVGFELAAGDAIEPFRTLEITLTLFRTQATGIVADPIAVEELVGFTHFDVKVEHALFFKDLNVNR